MAEGWPGTRSLQAGWTQMHKLLSLLVLLSAKPFVMQTGCTQTCIYRDEHTHAANIKKSKIRSQADKWATEKRRGARGFERTHSHKHLPLIWKHRMVSLGNSLPSLCRQPRKQTRRLSAPTADEQRGGTRITDNQLIHLHQNTGVDM